MYKIVGRIVEGRDTIGYRLIDENKSIVNKTKNETLRLAINKKIANAGYNKNKNTLEGNGIDLRKIGVIRKDDLVRSRNRQYNIKTNHQLAEEYALKKKLIGGGIKYELLENDRVALVGVDNTESTGRIIIPSFITNIEIDNHGSYIEKDIVGPLADSKYTEVYLNNREGVKINIRGLCSHMKSKTIKFRCRHPEDIIDASYLFSNCNNAEEIDIGGLSIMNAISISSMFLGCIMMKELNLKGIKTNNCENMSNMFCRCRSLRSLDLREIDTHNVEYMAGMFRDCYGLIKINLSNFKTSNVISMLDMFNGCRDLKNLDISNFDTRNVEIMDGMFSGCKALESLDVSGFVTEKVRGAYGMFALCQSLKYLDLSRFSTENMDDISLLLAGCANLKSINRDNIRVSMYTEYIKIFEGSGIEGKVSIEWV